jgi:hypothetical protein
MTEREKQLRRDAELAMSTAMWLDDEIANTLDTLIALEEQKEDPAQIQSQQDRLGDLLVRVSTEKENIERIAEELDNFIKKNEHKKQYSISFKK